MVAERDTPATAAAPLPLSGPRHKLARLLSGEHCCRAVENTAAQRYRSAVIVEWKVGTAES